MSERVAFRPAFNDAARGVIAASARVLGMVCVMVQRYRAAAFFRMQAKLRRRYRIEPDTPIRFYGPELEAEIRRAAAPYGRDAQWAETSGSTGTPKRILYTQHRLRAAQWGFIDHFARLFFCHRVRRTSLYLFRPLEGADGIDDTSLTAMLVKERQLPSYFATLQAPYRVEGHPVIQALVKRYGPNAVRLWILATANPGALYSTNPSTLWMFLREVAGDWQRSRQLIADLCIGPETFDPAVHAIAARLDSAGSAERLARIADSATALPLSVCAPAVRLLVCWTGGYVGPFLDRITAILPPDAYRIVPMYSMSTETIETTSWFGRDGVAFLPLAPRVLYEFLEEGLADYPENLRQPDELQPMKAYTLVVSDSFGLRRYQTEDVFRCAGYANALPDLRFLRRRNLEYSFTGEKVSSLQLDRVFARIRDGSTMTALSAGAFLTCAPSHPPDDPAPHYRFVLVWDSDRDRVAKACVDAIARECDRLLCEENLEYRSKRRTGRLGAPRCSGLPLAEFVARFSGAGGADGQFKFLPLYRRTWEEAEAVRHTFPGRNLQAV